MQVCTGNPPTTALPCSTISTAMRPRRTRFRTLASDNRRKGFFDSNDFGAVFSQVQKDSSAYYVLGFTSTQMQ